MLASPRYRELSVQCIRVETLKQLTVRIASESFIPVDRFEHVEYLVLVRAHIRARWSSNMYWPYVLEHCCRELLLKTWIENPQTLRRGRIEASSRSGGHVFFWQRPGLKGGLKGGWPSILRPESAS